MTLFIAVVAVGAPLLSSFPDAAVVNWFQGESFVWSYAGGWPPTS